MLTVPIAALVILERDDRQKEGGPRSRRRAYSPSPTAAACSARWARASPADMYIEITSGLKEKDEIVTGPFATLKKLKDGDKVTLSRNKR